MSRARGENPLNGGSGEISRRDFLNGVLIASGAAVGRSAPMDALAAAREPCDGAIGLDPRVLRGGDLPSTFEIAHWMRDRRLRFESNAVTLGPGCDAFEGVFPIAEDDEQYDVIIIGGGLAGLSAAFHLLRARPSLRLLLLEAGPRLGGNAGRDDAPPLPVPASTAGAYGAAPATDYLRDFYRTIGVDWNAQAIEYPVSNYYFDEYTPGVRPGHRGWSIDTFEQGLADVPYERRIVDDLLRTRQSIRALAEDGRGIADPADESDEKHDDLSTVSLRRYLEETLHCDPAVTDFYTIYTLTAFGGAAHQVNAHSAASFLSGEFTHDGLFTFPGGTSELARLVQRWFVTSAADRAYRLRIETNAVALRIEPSFARGGAKVVYFHGGGFRHVAATKVVVAAPAQSARRLVEHFADDARKAAWGEFHAAPLVVANVVLRSAAPLLDLNLGYSQSWWGGRHFMNYVVADWVDGSRHLADRQTVLTFYGGCDAPLDEFANERLKLLRTPFGDYEDSLKSDLARLMRSADFDFERDVRAVFLYRWGHSMLRPPPNWLFGDARGADGRLDRSKAPRRIAGSPLGPVYFAGQHTEGTPSVESAIGSGRRAALQALDDL